MFFFLSNIIIILLHKGIRNLNGLHTVKNYITCNSLKYCNVKIGSKLGSNLHKISFYLNNIATTVIGFSINFSIPYTPSHTDTYLFRCSILQLKFTI